MMRIEKFYKTAVSEDEGFGTAYEYMMKDRLMRKFIPSKVENILLAGIPEKYGYALNVLILTDQFAKETLVIEDRPERLRRFEKILAEASKQGLIKHPEVIKTKLVQSVEKYKIEKTYSMIVSMEVIQRIEDEKQKDYLDYLLDHGNMIYVFSPNVYHEAHRLVTHLDTIEPFEMAKLIDTKKGKVLKAGFVDCPPFASGKELTQEQREAGLKKSAGIMQKMKLKAMLLVLNTLTYREHILPHSSRKKNSHIAFLIISRKG